MAIKKIKIGTTEHELQTSITNVDGLQAKLDELEDSKAAVNHAHIIVMTDDNAGNVTMTLGNYDGGHVPNIFVLTDEPSADVGSYGDIALVIGD